MSTRKCPFVSRGGIKLAAALDAFHLDVHGLTCADLGASTGGFTDCLLQRGAARVFALDTAYGQLDWKLRNDPRVTVLERTNALHPRKPCPVDLVVIDLGWTRQSLAIPAALLWTPSHIVTLIKPHYETDDVPAGGVIEEQTAQAVCQRVLDALPALGVRVLAHIRSPIRGSAGKGNVEFLAHLVRTT